MICSATRLIAAELEQHGLIYRVNEEDSFSDVTVGFNCKNINSIEVRFVSTDDDSDVKVRLFSLLRVPVEKRGVVLEQLNTLNNRYRFSKFSLDDGGDVNMAYDFAVSTGSDCIAACCFEMLRRFVNIADEAYPEIMKALWS